MTKKQNSGKGFSSFSPMFWLVVMFEFFERGSYYGVMSILSVYLTEHLHFAKESVGLIKGTIQPLLYFLPIISGALADRFGYRRTLMFAFSFLGLGYFLTAQATDYALVFGALVVMGIGAGAFKPVISGTIARVTDEENSTLGFGIFYWSINLGAFLFPLILVPFLKQLNWSYVLIAAAVCTAAMLLPTIFFYREPVKQAPETKAGQTSLIQTLANAFEIIYSPVVLIYYSMKKTVLKRTVILAVLILAFGYALFSYLQTPVSSESYPSVGIRQGKTVIVFTVDRNMLAQNDFVFRQTAADSSRLAVTIHKPRQLEEFAPALLDSLHRYPDLSGLTRSDIERFMKLSDNKVTIYFTRQDLGDKPFKILEQGGQTFTILMNPNKNFSDIREDLMLQLDRFPVLEGIGVTDLQGLYAKSGGRSFFLLYVIGIILLALGIIAYSTRRSGAAESIDQQPSYATPFFIVTAIGLLLWFLPGLTILGRIISFIIYLTVTSLFIIDKSSQPKFVDHAKFLLMIFLYSGFWILYFQMFDSVLWYVQAYVDATSLNNAVNAVPGFFGIETHWFFDVEHVTVINAGTIILLQLFISSIVKKTRALPTMITGITFATLGMAILAISTDIWFFMAGTIIFSIGEMTAHPKFISYIGLIAPPDKKAMYMGYLFLYGVFGSSIGGILGAKLYVHFVDTLNQPKVLWLIFSGIGVATIVALLLYNKFLAEKPSASQ